jgi:hypothetical protein
MIEEEREEKAEWINCLLIKLLIWIYFPINERFMLREIQDIQDICETKEMHKNEEMNEEMFLL